MKPFIVLTHNTAFGLPNFGVVLSTLRTKYIFVLVGALMAFLRNSLSRKLKSTSRDVFLEKIWQCAWIWGLGEPARAAVITVSQVCE